MALDRIFDLYAHLLSVCLPFWNRSRPSLLVDNQLPSCVRCTHSLTPLSLSLVGAHHLSRFHTSDRHSRLETEDKGIGHGRRGENFAAVQSEEGVATPSFYRIPRVSPKFSLPPPNSLTLLAVPTRRSTLWSTSIHCLLILHFFLHPSNISICTSRILSVLVASR